MPPTVRASADDRAVGLILREDLDVSATAAERDAVSLEGLLDAAGVCR